MATSDRLARALRALGERFPSPPDWEPPSAPVGTEKATPDQEIGRAVPTVPTVPSENETADDDGGVWEERAAILEYDGGFDRAEAEARAIAELGFRPPA